MYSAVTRRCECVPSVAVAVRSKADVVDISHCQWHFRLQAFAACHDLGLLAFIVGM